MSHQHTYYVTVVFDYSIRFSSIFAIVSFITNPNLQYNINNGHRI